MNDIKKSADLFWEKALKLAEEGDTSYLTCAMDRCNQVDSKISADRQRSMASEIRNSEDKESEQFVDYKERERLAALDYLKYILKEKYKW